MVASSFPPSSPLWIFWPTWVISDILLFVLFPFELLLLCVLQVQEGSLVAYLQGIHQFLLSHFGQCSFRHWVFISSFLILFRRFLLCRFLWVAATPVWIFHRTVFFLLFTSFCFFSCLLWDFCWFCWCWCCYRTVFFLLFASFCFFCCLLWGLCWFCWCWCCCLFTAGWFCFNIFFFCCSSVPASFLFVLLLLKPLVDLLSKLL